MQRAVVPALAAAWPLHVVQTQDAGMGWGMMGYDGVDWWEPAESGSLATTSDSAAWTRSNAQFLAPSCGAPKIFGESACTCRVGIVFFQGTILGF